MMRPLVPPIRGATNATTFKGNPPGFVPLGSIKNVQIFGPDTDRPQIKKRPGLRKLIPSRVGQRDVQCLRPVATASVVSGYAVADCRMIAAGQSIESVTLTGDYWHLDSVPSLIRPGYLDVTGLGGPAGGSVNATAVWRSTPAGLGYQLAAVSKNYMVAGKWQSTIRIFRSDTGATTATATITHATQPRRINSLHWGRDFLFACCENLIFVLRTDGTVIDSYDMGGWASEAIAAGTFLDGTTEYLYVAFNGWDGGVTAPFGPITAGQPAICFRSGVMKFEVDPSHISPIGPYVNAEVLTQEPWGQTFDPNPPYTINNASWTYYETFHGYFRISEWSAARPRGCKIQGMAVASDGTVVLATTNTGYGPTAAFPPHLASTPRLSVRRISAAGVLVGEYDIDSVVESGLDGFLNDINNPTLEGVDLDAAGDIYVAGRRNAANHSAWKLRGSSGARVWSTNLQSATGKIREGGVRFDFTDGNVVMVGDRNSAWTGSTGNANFWKLDAATGTVLQSFDLGAAVSGLGVAVTPAGEYVMGTDHF